MGKKIEKREERDKSDVLFGCAVSISLIVFFGIVIALIYNIFPDQISFFGLPLEIGYVVFSVFLILFWVIIRKLRIFANNHGKKRN